MKTEYQKILHSYINKGIWHPCPKQKNPLKRYGIYLIFQLWEWIKHSQKFALYSIAQKKTDGIPLNYVIHAGPKLQKELFDLHIRFRRTPVALACDIKEMYLEVQVENNDRSMFRLLWR